jgi:hypothetical protein
MENYSFWKMIKKTSIHLALVNIAYYALKLTIFNDSGLFSFKYLFIDTIGYIACICCLSYIIIKNLKIYIRKNDKVLRKSGLKFGATALAMSKFISVPVGAIVVNNLIPNLGPMSNTMSILGFPFFFILAGILGGVIGFIGEILLKISN